MSETTWPQPLEPVSGPFTAARIDGAAQGMGSHGPITTSLVGQGLLPPDLLCGMTLFLLARQPRQPRSADSPGAESQASAIAGGVWVRERFTIHRPLDRDDPFRVTGDAVGRHVRKGRRYGTTSSTTVDAQGRPVATNLTTGLLSYRPEPGLGDSVEGPEADEIPSPGADRGAAAANPHLDRLREVAVGDRVGGDEIILSLAMMAARDTAQPDNPIHSDPEEARRAGLSRPIAGGSHVLAFVLEPLLGAWGPEALFHGAAFDVRWKAPTEADAAIVPTATVVAADDETVVVDATVTLAATGAVAMTAEIVVPLSGSDTRPSR